MSELEERDARQFEEIVREKFDEYGYKSGFESFKSVPAPGTDIIITVAIREAKGNLCSSPFGTRKGNLYIKLEWNLYSQKDLTRILKFNTEGKGELDGFTSGGAGQIKYEAFSMAVVNMLANEDFHKIMNPPMQPTALSLFYESPKVSAKSPPVVVVSSPVSHKEWEETLNEIKKRCITKKCFEHQLLDGLDTVKTVEELIYDPEFNQSRTVLLREFVKGQLLVEYHTILTSQISEVKQGILNKRQQYGDHIPNRIFVESWGNLREAARSLDLPEPGEMVIESE